MADADELSTNPAGRKRNLPQFDAEASPSALNGPATKKRRYGDLATAPSPSTPRGFRAITSAIGNVLFGRQQADATATSQAKLEADSLYDDIPSSGDDIAPGKNDLPIKYGKFSRDVSKENLSDSRALPKEPTNSIRKPKRSPQKQIIAAGNVESTDDQQTTPTRRKTAQKPAARAKSGSLKALPVARNKKLVQDSDQDESGLSDSTALQRPVAPLLKGILSPSKKRIGTPRKNVAFEGDARAVQEEIFFADPLVKAKPTPKQPASARKPRSLLSIEFEKTPTVTDEREHEIAIAAIPIQQSLDDSIDDEVCVICNKPDSEPPNEILFCENCNLGYHQECHNVPVIPEGDWICKNCSQEDAVVTDGRKAYGTTEITAKASIAAPPIPNFETHLRSMQRVLLDRCSGTRRIKLCDQEEAYDKAYQLMEQTVLAGEGNSMMVIGARGCGKSTVCTTSLSWPYKLSLGANTYQSLSKQSSQISRPSTPPSFTLYD